MKEIDRLLIKAKRIVAGDGLYMGMVLQEGGKWVAVAHFWDGVQGSGGSVEKTPCDTMDAAIDHLHAVAEKRPNKSDVPIIIDDL